LQNNSVRSHGGEALAILQNQPVELKKPPHISMRRLNLMAGEQGFEPWNAGIKIRCLNQLGDSPTQPFVCRFLFCRYSSDILTPNQIFI
jgi:hypothetical protein